MRVSNYFWSCFTRVLILFINIGLFNSVNAYTVQDLADAYSYLNQIRSNAGLLQYTQNNQLEAAATGHAVYLATNGFSGHYQNQSTHPVNFTGSTPEDRITAAGYTYYHEIGENVSVLISSDRVLAPVQSIDELLTAIYHRFGFLDFNLYEAGIGLAEAPFALNSNLTHSALVYDMAVQTAVLYTQRRGLNPGIVLWPPIGDHGTQAGFYTENPYPLSAIGYADGTPVGNPVSIQFNDASYSSASVSAFKLYRVADGVEITDTYLMHQGNDPHSLFTAHQFALFPLKHLEWGRTYRAVADYTTDLYSGTLDWQFTTKCLGVPLLTVTGNSDLVDIPPGLRTFAVYVDADKPVAKSYSSVGGLSQLEVSTEDFNTLLLTTNGSSGQGATIHLSDGSDNWAFTLLLSDGAGLPAPVCEANTAVYPSLVNISTRAAVNGGENDAFAGFVVSGDGTQQVMLRGMATDSGVDPAIVLLKQEGGAWVEVARNDEWELDSNVAAVTGLSGHLQLPDLYGNDAGLLRDLAAGVYSVQLSSQASAGKAVVGVDAVTSNGPELINISTRAYVGGGENDAFAGFVITGTATQKVMLRGIAVDSGVDPSIVLLRQEGSAWITLATNDEWEQDANAPAVGALNVNLQLPDSYGNDAGLLRDLSPGVYSVVLSSNGVPGKAVVGVDVVQ